MNSQSGLRRLSGVQWITCALLLIAAFAGLLIVVDAQAKETLSWCLDQRADPSSWDMQVVRYPLKDYDPENPPENQSLHSVLSQVSDEEGLGSLPEQRTVQLLDGWPHVRAYYYLQEGPLEPLYGPGLWVVMVDVSQAIHAINAAWVIVAASAFLGLLVQQFLLRTASKAIAQNYEQIRSRYVLGSHEVKGPLMAIRGFVEACEDGLMNPQELAGLVAEEVAKIQQTLDDLAKLAWVEEDKELVQMTRIDLAPYLLDEAQRGRWSSEAPRTSGFLAIWADAFLVDQALSTLSHWMDRCDLAPQYIEAAGLELRPSRQSRVAQLDQRVALTLSFAEPLSKKAAKDVALTLLLAIQDLQAGDLVVDADRGMVQLRWRTV